MLLLYAEQNATYIPLLQNAQHEALSYRLRLYERVNRRTLYRVEVCTLSSAFSAVCRLCRLIGYDAGQRLLGFPFMTGMYRYGSMATAVV